MIQFCAFLQDILNDQTNGSQLHMEYLGSFKNGCLDPFPEILI